MLVIFESSRLRVAEVLLMYLCSSDRSPWFYKPKHEDCSHQLKPSRVASLWGLAMKAAQVAKIWIVDCFFQMSAWEFILQK